MKPCTKCLEIKEDDEFYLCTRPYNRSLSYRSPKCKSCHVKYGRQWWRRNPEKVRKNWLKVHYGITVEEYDKLFVSQGGVCAICGDPERKKRYLCVDHSHSTGMVRGLLCDHCNTSLGKMRDSVLLLRKAADYLEKSVRRF